MTRLGSNKPSGDFLTFPYTTNDNLHVYRVTPHTADDRIPASLPHVKCVDLVKPAGSADIAIYLHSESDSMPAQDGYSLEPVRAGIDIGEVSRPYILTNANGHFFVPMASESLLYDLLDLTRKMSGYAGIRVVPYNVQHSIDGLANATDRWLDEIRSPVIKYVTKHVGEKEVKERVERDHQEKGGEFDRYGNELVEKMRQYASLRIYSVYLLAGPEDYAFVAGHSYPSTISALDRLQFIPVRPTKKWAGWKRVKVDPMEVVGTPLFFDIRPVNKKCSDRYFKDNIIYSRLHSPVTCTSSDLLFPFSHPLVAKTAPTKKIADRVNRDDLFDDPAGSGSGGVIDEDFFDSGGAS